MYRPEVMSPCVVRVILWFVCLFLFFAESRVGKFAVGNCDKRDKQLGVLSCGDDCAVPCRWDLWRVTSLCVK